MNAPRGDASARPVGNYLHGCDSSEPISPRSLCTASRHGTVNAYKNHGCRCPIACRAWSRYMKDYRLRRLRGVRNLIDATGTVRRLRALQAIGWTTGDLGGHLNCSGTAVSQLARRALVQRATAVKVCQVYEQLADTRGTSQYTATLAANRGWLPPIWWDDNLVDDPAHDPRQVLEFIAGKIDSKDSFCKEKEIVDNIAIERFVAGDTTVTLTRAEKPEAYQAFLARGISHNQAAIRLGLSGTTARKLAESSRSGAQVVGVREDRDTDDKRSAAS